ncbi:succinate-semialdehyde dehydrogenase [Haloprofundus marisrubri]|uniref:Succinate-semialdehyde dehydrogenase n=1 Tax=Haloprofundus marisrubri TaxID=1514971 RepID=A0A0W1R728_9EURY|nr:succinic semialdehyde dehydrogenase [Haloprofundus marisrubri]KTG09226.1 succinate-semialdehyde dehydrogenase [Haloprofundus marisrubri]
MNSEVTSVRPTADLDALRTVAAETSSSASLSVEAPFTGESLGTVPAATAEDVVDAAGRAREAQSEWAAQPFEERAAVFSRFHDRLLARREELLELMQAESGKSKRDAFVELLDVALTAQYYSTQGDDHLQRERRSSVFPLLSKVTVNYRPVGVVGLITPWNYPLTLSISDAIPALLAGNAVVLKPDEGTPFTALYAAHLLVDCGLPSDLLQVVTGRGDELGESLVASVDFVGFTGSVDVGRIVGSLAGEHLVDCSLELGGKNPGVVLDDADVDAAAADAVVGCFSNAGQLCLSTERLYVHTDVYDAFLDAFVARTRALSVGAAFGDDVEVGSLVSADQLEKTTEHVEDAVQKGATVLSGGRPRPDRGPYVYEPTVLTDVTPEMTLFRSETFGPVVSVYRVEDEDEAVERANDSDRGLNGSVWTGEEARGEAVAERIECGTVNVNDAYATAWSSVDAPMGGMKESGVGRRHGPEGIRKYTESQTVAVDRGAPTMPPDSIPDAWWQRGMVALLGAQKRVVEWLR